MREETKIFLGVIIFLALIFGGVVWYSNKNNVNTPVSTDVLVRSDSQKIGPLEAKVTLVEFGDYQCPACGAIYPLVKQALKDYEGEIMFVYRNFPLSQHQNAIIAAEAAEIAGDQGKFWEMNGALFEHQNKWANSKEPKNLFTQYAKDLGMNVDEFTKSLNENKYSDKIQRDQNDGNSVSVNSTPTFFINGQKLLLSRGEDLKNAIEKILKEDTPK